MSAAVPPLLDVSATLGRLPNDAAGGDAHALLTVMDRLGISGAVVSHLEAWRHAPATGNERVCAEVRDEPRLRACWVALPEGTGEVPPPTHFAAEAVDRGVVAVRVLPLDHGWSLGSGGATELAESLAAQGLPLLVDADQTTWGDLDALAGRVPELAIIVSRLGYRTTRTWAPILRRRHGIHLDLSYLGGHGALEWFVTEFGAERAVFGTATPVVDPAGPVARLAWSGLDDDVVRSIARDNARALLPRWSE